MDQSKLPKTVTLTITASLIEKAIQREDITGEYPIYHPVLPGLVGSTGTTKKGHLVVGERDTQGLYGIDQRALWNAYVVAIDRADLILPLP